MFQTSGKHLLGLLNDIIDLSRIESGQLETEKIGLDLVRALNFVRNLFALKAQEQGLQFVVDTRSIKPISNFFGSYHRNRRETFDRKMRYCV